MSKTQQLKSKYVPIRPKSRIISDKDEILKSICAEAPGGNQLDEESGEPDADCAYAKLIGNGYKGVSLGSVDEKEWAP